jgi:hypothetical protein
MLSVPRINSPNNPESPDRCPCCAELFSARQWDGHPWVGLAEHVLRSWRMTSRAALLLVIGLAGAVAIVLALGSTGPFTVVDLPYLLLRRGHV